MAKVETKKLPLQKVKPVPTPINSNALEFYLHDYLSTEKDFLLKGFSEGFSLHYEGPRMKRTSRNNFSALLNPSEVLKKLNSEICAGRIAGPFSSPPFTNFQQSPISLVPKSKPGEFRLIHDLSFGTAGGGSVNSFIPREYCTVEYESLDNIIN